MAASGAQLLGVAQAQGLRSARGVLVDTFAHISSSSTESKQSNQEEHKDSSSTFHTVCSGVNPAPSNLFPTRSNSSPHPLAIGYRRLGLSLDKRVAPQATQPCHPCTPFWFTAPLRPEHPWQLTQSTQSSHLPASTKSEPQFCYGSSCLVTKMGLTRRSWCIWCTMCLCTEYLSARWTAEVRAGRMAVEGLER